MVGKAMMRWGFMDTTTKKSNIMKMSLRMEIITSMVLSHFGVGQNSD